MPLKNGAFHNFTHCLVESFGESATYTFIGTSESIKIQQEIFANLPQSQSQNLCKAIFEKFSPQILPQNDELKDIFHKILMAIKLCRTKNIIIDITHGFRHQPIIASFANTLAKQIYANAKKRITLIFAKANADGTYRYVSLEQYSRISLIAMSLQNFVKTLSMPKNHANEPFMVSLYTFVSALHANAFSQIFDLLDKSLYRLNQAKNSERFKGLESILDEVEKVLLQFEAIKNGINAYIKGKNTICDFSS